MSIEKRIIISLVILAIAALGITIQDLYHRAKIETMVEAIMEEEFPKRIGDTPGGTPVDLSTYIEVVDEMVVELSVADVEYGTLTYDVILWNYDPYFERCI